MEIHPLSFPIIAPGRGSEQESEVNPQLAQYAADQTVNTVKGVGSILTGNPYDYYSEYAEDWKKANDQKYTPFEMAANTVGRNVYAGLGQLQGGLASTADMLLPDQITPEPVQESLDWMKQSTENVNNWANEFNQETGQTVLPQVLQAAGGMAPDLALAFATGGASLAGKVCGPGIEKQNHEPQRNEGACSEK